MSALTQAFAGAAGDRRQHVVDDGPAAGLDIGSHGHAGLRTFNPSDLIDFADVAFGPNTSVAYSPKSSNEGTLSISVNGAQRAQVSLFGQLMSTTFTAQSDGAAGTLVVAHQAPASAPTLATPI